MYRMTSDEKIAQRLTLFPETSYKSKLSKTPSVRAITNYYNMSTDNEIATYDNLSFIPEENNSSRYSESYPKDIDSSVYYSTNCSSNTSTTDHAAPTFRNDGSGNLGNLIASANDEYEYAAYGGSSVRTCGSEVGSEKRDELGSTSRLVSPKVKSTCQCWFSHAETVLITLSLAAGFGNLYRLPQTTLIRGELPFLVAYVTLSILIGFPLLFLELGVGQLAQEGFIKIWRAVPFFKGVGYVKLAAGCLLVVYYPLYMGLCLYYVIWLVKEPLPFSQCASVRMTENGYVTTAKSGQECLQKTFLQSPYTEPKWFGYYVLILLFVWALLTFISFRRTRSFVNSLVVLCFPLLALFIALLVRATLTDAKPGLDKLIENADWSTLGSANVWYYAAIQVFFSTNIGFGAFVTSAGVIYNKVNPLWMAILHTLAHLIFGIGFTIMFYILTTHLDLFPLDGSTAEVHLISVIYDNAVKNATEFHDMRIWTAQIYAILFIAGCISMVLFIYTLLKVIEIELKHRLSWWQFTIILGCVGFFLGTLALLVPNFEILHLLDHYIVGNFVLISVILEVLAFIIFYSIKRLQLDFEFILGRRLTKIWYGLWWFAPIILLVFFVWALTTLPLTGILVSDPQWLYGIGWGAVLCAIIFILSIGLYTVSKQEEFFTFSDKLKATLKPSRKWGPVDPILRYNWVQWHSKAKEGQRDFTLKRRGTKDYTHSIKKYSTAQPKSYRTSSELSTTSGSAVYHKNVNDQNQNNIRFSNGSSNYAEPYVVNGNYGPNLVQTNGDVQLRVTSLVDSFDPPLVHMYINDQVTNSGNAFKPALNPLGRANMYSDVGHDGSNSEGYGTFRKGPYIINDDVGHVCHRKFDQSEAATSL